MHQTKWTPAVVPRKHKLPVHAAGATIAIEVCSNYPSYILLWQFLFRNFEIP